MLKRYDKPLSNHEIANLLKIKELKHARINNLNMVEFDNLKHYETLEELFNGQGHVLGFIDYGNKIGHWVSLLVNPDKSILFFDSLGKKLKNYDKNGYIEQLAKKEGFKIVENKTKFQNDSSNTCGKFAILNIFFNKLGISHDEIIKLWKLIKRSYGNVDNFLLDIFKN